MLETNPIFQLREWHVDIVTGEIRRDDGMCRRIEPRPMAVLACLAEAPGTVVSKQELMDSVWADACVGEDSVWRAIYGLRKALEDDGAERRFIETVPKRGYRLVPPVLPEPAKPALPAREPAPAKVSSTEASSIDRAPSIDRATSINSSGDVPRTGRRGAGWLYVALLALLACALLLVGDHQVSPLNAMVQRARPDKATPASFEVDRDSVEVLVDSELSASAFLELARQYYDGQTTSWELADPDLGRAAALFERALDRDPSMRVAEAELLSVRCLQATRARWNRADLLAARDRALTVIDAAPDLPEGYKALGMIEQKLGRLAAAQAAYRRALDLRPGYVQALEGLAVVYSLRGWVWEALDIRRFLLTSDLPSGRMLGLTGWSLLNVGQLDEAGRYLRAALDQEPFQVLATLGLAEIDDRAGNPLAGRNRLLAALEVHRDSSHLYYALGQLALEAEALDEAENWFQQATQQPDLSTAWPWIRLAEIHQRRGQTDQADELLSRAAERLQNGSQRDPEMFLPRLLLAAVYSLQGRQKEALDRLEEAVDLGLVDVDSLHRDSAFDAIEDDPRFKVLVERSKPRRRS